jgi:hypothetical protein
MSLPELTDSVYELETTVTHDPLSGCLLMHATTRLSDFTNLRCLSMTLNGDYREVELRCVLPTMPCLHTLKIHVEVAYPTEGDPNDWTRSVILILDEEPSLRHLEMHLEDTSQVKFTERWSPEKLEYVSLDAVNGEELSDFTCLETALLSTTKPMPKLHTLRLHSVSDLVGLGAVLANTTSLTHLSIGCFHPTWGVQGPCAALTRAIALHLAELKCLQLPPVMWDAKQFGGLTKLTSLIVTPRWSALEPTPRFGPVMELCAMLPLVEMVRHGGSWFKREEWLACC